jgi:hypothetical protein
MAGRGAASAAAGADAPVDLLAGDAVGIAGPGAPGLRPICGNSGSGGIWTRLSPLKLLEVGADSCAGISSFRTNLSGSSHHISNSIATRLLPRS